MDVWSDKISDDLNRIENKLGLKEDNELFTRSVEKDYTVRSMRNDVTVKCQPDMESVLGEIQGRTSPDFLSHNGKNLIDLLKDSADGKHP